VTGSPAAVGTTALLGALGGLLVPLLIARIPEPAPAEEDRADPAKESYRAIAGSPGLAARSAVVAAVAAGSIGAGLGWAWPLVFLLPFVPVAVALAVVDWRTRLLPTRVVGPAYVGLVLLVVACAAITGDGDDLVRAGWGWLVAGGVFLLLWLVHPRGLGYGDVRLSGVLGIALGYLGWGPLLLGVWAGFLLGGVVGGLLTATGVLDRRGVPFGPFMLVGALVGILAGPGLWGHLVTAPP
jgi:leader peptidase (prepilin peptidase) / N-methyltransferase